MKYKICPHCGTHNEPSEYECINCGIDLTNVRATDEENEKAAIIEEHYQETTIMVRVCENCGHANPMNVGECQECGEDLTGIIPQPKAASKQKAHRIQVTLASVDGEYAFELQPGTTVVGRAEAMAEYLGKKRFVSRKHAEFSLVDGVVSILNISQSNYTFINDKMIIAEKIELHDGDIIGLGGNNHNGQRQDGAAYFQVRICECL